MTKEQILNCEHAIINGIVNWDDDTKDMTRTYYYIMGVHDMAKRLITGMDKICVSATEDNK